MAKFTPLQRALSVLRSEGYHAEKAVRWSGCLRRRRRPFGFADLLAFRADQWGALAVRVTTAALAEDGLLEVPDLPELRHWLACGCRFSLWAWRKERRRWLLDRYPVQIWQLAAGGKALPLLTPGWEAA